MTSTKKESLNYQSLVKEAIVSLKERNGSSPQAIAKYLESSSEHKDKLPQNFRKLLQYQLKRLEKAGKLIKVKASYKLGDELKKAPKKAKPATKKPAAKPKAAEKKSPAKPKASKPKKAAPEKKVT
ncbi:hypothetical protein MMC16_007886, partial [Acarospora aff. strigata]|nr:hypothetical protein [Acarospora aff. strigata]